MSKFDRISSFITVVQEHSFAAAARKQGLSTPAISRQISQLEAELGAQLLQRTTRQLSLTEIGQQYYQQCKKLLAELAEAETAIVNSKNEPIGALHITSTHYFALEYLIPHLAEFMSLYPKLQINLELAERFPNLAIENVDLLFGVSMDGPEELVRTKVADTRYVLCATPHYLKHYGTPITPEDLSRHRYITHSMRNPDNLLTFKNNQKIIIEPILSLNDSRAMRECALQSIGLVSLHEYIVTDAIKNKQLIEVLPNYQSSLQPVYLYYQKSRFLQPKIRLFIDFYLARIKPSANLAR